MPSSASSHNFSLPSFVYRSRSHQDLHPREQNSSILYTTAAHSATETALPNIREESSALLSDNGDDAVTALPPPTREPKRKISFWGRPASPGTEKKSAVLKKRAPTVTTSVAASTPGARATSPTTKRSKTTWARIASKFKSPFRGLKFGRGLMGSGKKAPPVIGAPSNFQHLESGAGPERRRAHGRYSLGGGDVLEDVMEVSHGQDSEWEDYDE